MDNLTKVNFFVETLKTITKYKEGFVATVPNERDTVKFADDEKRYKVIEREVVYNNKLTLNINYINIYLVEG